MPAQDLVRCHVAGHVVAGDSPAMNWLGSRGRLARSHIATLASIFFLVGILLAISVGARAQASPSASPEPSVSTVNRDLEKESRKAASEDEQAQFKHSWLVKWVAQVSGLSLDGAYWLCVVLNFAVIAGAAVYFSRKYLPGTFRDRTAFIQKAMQEARQASEDANRRLAEIETRLSRLDSEIAGLGAAAEKEAVAEEARIKAAAEEDARKIVESAEQEIAAAAKAARRELTAYAANLAVSLAGKQIKVDTATDQALVRDFARDLSAKDGGSKTGQDKN